MRALPFELQPQVKIKETPGIEPGTYRTAVDCSTPELYLQYLDTPSGTRTRNLQIRSLTRYPVAPHGRGLKLPTPGLEPLSLIHI